MLMPSSDILCFVIAIVVIPELGWEQCIRVYAYGKLMYANHSACSIEAKIIKKIYSGHKFLEAVLLKCLNNILV